MSPVLLEQPIDVPSRFKIESIASRSPSIAPPVVATQNVPTLTPDEELALQVKYKLARYIVRKIHTRSSSYHSWHAWHHSITRVNTTDSNMDRKVRFPETK